MKKEVPEIPEIKSTWPRTGRIIFIIFTTFIAMLISWGYQHIQFNEQTDQAEIRMSGYKSILIEKQSKELNQVTEENKKLKKLIAIPQEQKVALKVCQVFKDDCKTALMVIKAESGLDPRAQGWNCRYGPISKACTPLDRWRAWSVDCGIMQNNLVGYKNCPEWAYDVDWGLKTGYAKYARRSWQPWVAYTRGKHLAHGNWADQLLAKQKEYLALGI